MQFGAFDEVGSWLVKDLILFLESCSKYLELETYHCVLNEISN